MDHAEMTPLYVFMNPSAGQAARMRDGETDAPRWFAYPFARAGYAPRFGLSILPGLPQLARLIRQRPDTQILVFNVSLAETLACVLFGRRAGVCSLFQWIPLELLPWHKRLCYKQVLGSSRVVVVYDQLSEDYVRERYPRTPVVRTGLYVDTEFFSPDKCGGGQGEYLVCPGGNMRNEGIVRAIAERSGRKVIRFSNDPGIKSHYESHPSDFVEFRFNIPYTEMRELYGSAHAVINVADDRHIPAGLYAFCQAIAMGCMVITPGGHSSAGYALADGTRPYVVVEEPDDVASWCAAITRTEDADLRSRFRSQARMLAGEYCSLERSVSDWSRVRSFLTQGALA